MRLWNIFKSFERKKEFPERGTYKGVSYRIDGDSVMLTLRSGKEMQIGPKAAVTTQQFDQIKAEVIAGKSELLGLGTFRPSTFRYDTKGSNAIDSTGHSSRELWGISEWKERYLLDLGEEIMINYYRSRAEQRKT